MNRFVIIQTGFILLTLICSVWLFILIDRGLQRTSLPEVKRKRITKGLIIGWVAWMGFIGLWSISGTMINFSIFPFNILPAVGLPLLATLWLCSFSPTTGLILDQLENHQIILLQVFRLFVEILLWMLLLENVLPIQMSFEGRNFDIVAGITAPLIAYLSFHKKISKPIVVIWNMLSLALLVNIVSIAILSMPTPFRYFMNEPANVVVGQFPIAYLPGFLVPLAFGLHLLSLRKLSRTKL